MMEKTNRLLGERVSADKELIAQLVHEEAVRDVSTEQLEMNKAFIDIVNKARIDFVELIGTSISNSCDVKKVYADVQEWGEETGNFFLETGRSLEDALAETSLYRKHIGTIIKTEAVRKDMELQLLFNVMEFFHSLLDHAAYSYTHAYTASYQRKLKSARKEFLELSAPVVPVSDQIAILPLVGSIEIDRARYILEQTLLAANELKINVLIVDLSGVVRVDSMVAEQIIKIIRSLKLVGVRSVLTGIRPEIALTLTEIGVDLKDLEIGGSLKRMLHQMNIN
ncbi:STAS domain-containing protein [Planococcus donghaensis]|uniref:STAS domain-containing protein n=2 Tax=Planococcus TaxID=1372 RepID=UPI003735BF5B